MTSIGLNRRLGYAVPAVVGTCALFAVVGWQAVLALPAAVLSYLAIRHYDLSLGHAASSRSEAEQFAQFLSSVHRETTVLSRPLIRSVALSHSKLPDGKIKSSLADLQARMRLGQRFEEAINTLGLEDRYSREAVQGLRSEGLGDGLGDRLGYALKRWSSNMAEGMRLADETASGSLHRYLVVSMVSTTILPSLAVFAFVGYSVLNYSLPYLLVFGAMLLYALPSVSAVVNMKVNSLYGA